MKSCRCYMLTILVGSAINILSLCEEKSLNLRLDVRVLLNLTPSLKQCSLAECYNYAVLDESSRAITYRGASYFCDRGLSGWYRFRGKAGSKMSHSCATGRRCGADEPGWLVGGHPSVSEGVTRRRVCFANSGGWLFGSPCCASSTDISVRNCGTFFVYKLGPVPSCNLRYCGDGISPETGGKVFCCLNYSVLKRKQRGLSHDR